MKVLIAQVCCLFVFTIGAQAQAPVGFNIAIQDPAFPVVPSATYGAAAYQTGVWNLATNQLPGPFTTAPMSDLNGNTTGLTLEFYGAQGWQSWDQPETAGDDEVLLDHGLWTPGSCNLRVDIHNLDAGSYRLFTYCLGDPFAMDCVSVQGSVDGTQDTSLADGFSDGFVQGKTHTVHRFTVQASESVIIRWGAFGAFLYDGRLDGFQIVPDGTSQAESYCDSTVNSTGSMANMIFSGTPSVAANDLVFGVRDLPLNQFGYFVVSQTIGSGVTPAGSQGTLCIGGAIGRHNRLGEVLFSGTAGAVLMPLDLTNVPQPLGPVAILPGETWHWQYWTRDQNPSSTSNFSDGNRLTFTQ
ncbi:MAG: hypothetical protein P1V35_03240 [Planctomycetota bacterium]|nr:hypothetical protein [Planctomycetota bacterium]